MSLWARHKILETNSILLILGILLVISIGGAVEAVPLFYLKDTVEKVEGVRPYTPLELAGRDVYVREGCYVCHSQMIRPLRDEVERYGHYSLAAESQYDHPFQWGSKRTGPDLARVGGKYSDEWQRAHLIDPRAVVPASIMPSYKTLWQNGIDIREITAEMRTLALIGTPYTQEMIDKAAQDLRTQATTDAEDSDGLAQRYAKAQSRDYDGDPGRVTEADALIAYLQMLGTGVNFKLYDDKANLR